MESPWPGRAHQVVLLLSLGGLAWVGMMAVHELGHVLGAWATGGRVQRVVWHPLAISRTDVAPNPRPLIVVWAGPVVGALLPAAAYATALLLQWSRPAPRALLAFFAGFCLIANGAYVGVGATEGVADAGVMLTLGSPRWVLMLFGAVAASLGLLIWSRESRWFGFGPSPTAVSARAAWTALAAAVAVAALGWVFGDAGS